MNKQPLLLFACLLFAFNILSAADKDLEKDPYPLFFLQKNLSMILINDNMSPPVASRDYVYPQIAAYTVLSKKDPNNILHRITHYPASLLNQNDAEKYSPSLAASYAFYLVAEKLVYTPQPFTDSFAVLINWYRNAGIDSTVFASSRKVGETVASSIIEWMNKDGFEETRRLNKYELLKEPGKWQLTSPGYFAAVEPHWGEIRSMIPKDKSALDMLLPVPFDTAATSIFYKEADYVYRAGKNLNTEQKLIASFWDCNPFALKPVGHINAIVKKISPGGHWMSIAGIACRYKELNLAETSKVFTLCAVAIYDAFIFTWDKKYLYSYLRPETFIEQYGIDGNWQPFIQSPPFPEFPSGHAVISNTAATVLSYLFGNDFYYIDDTETAFGLPKRSFNSFQAAADEATISRVYGGIHFLFSCTIGQKMGKILGNQIIDKLGR